MVVQVHAHARQVVHHGECRAACSWHPVPTPDSISSCGDCSAPALSSTSRGQRSSRARRPAVLDADGALAVEQDARGMRAGDDLQVGPARCGVR
jgi:hypothetical protein